MNRNQPFVTVRDPRDSVWQSMVERVARAADQDIPRDRDRPG